MTESKISVQIIQHIRERHLMAQIINWLDEKNEKFMAIIIDIIQHLVDRNSEQKVKQFFLII